MEQSDINLDNFIRDRIRRALVTGGIEPSPDFTARTMARIMSVQRRRCLLHDTYAVCLSILPIVLHQAWWYTVRGGDYFAVSNWPMGEYVSGAYRLFLSSLGLSALFVAGIILFVSYVFKFRRLRPTFAKTV